ncbi:MAG: serine hydrolase domain-containing protein [Caulobacteraceae bacterium]
MNITRRGWLGATAAGAAALSAPAMAAAEVRSAASAIDIPVARFQILSPGRRDYGPALEALAAYARDELLAIGLPGMTFGVSDSEGFLAVLTLGWADLCARAPMTADRLFQIGSISKSFLALTVLSLADAGKIDLDAPIAQYLPGAPWPETPITVAQVMSHTAGLPDGAPIFPRTPDGRLWIGFPAGSKFSYSNTGFDLLGAAVSHVTGGPYQTAILNRLRAPLGVAEIAARIGQANRPSFPTAYLPWDQTLAAEMPGARLDEATWDPEDSPAGSIAATSEMMARYLRGMMAIAGGGGGGVLSPAMARRFATPVIACDADFGPGSHYCLGVALQPVDGIPALHHTGGMVAFTSSFHADPAAGVAAFASVNARIGGYRPRQTTAYAIRLMRAVRAGAPLPGAPDPLGPSRPKDSAPLMGRFVGPDGSAFTISPGDDFPVVSGMGGAAPLYRVGGGLATPLPALARHSLDPMRPGGATSGPVTAIWWGETLFGRDAPLPRPAVPDRLRALAGIYINRDPWQGYAVLFARGEQLVLSGAGPVVDRGEWWSFEKDPGGVERARFDGVLNGRARRLNISGTDFERLGD